MLQKEDPLGVAGQLLGRLQPGVAGKVHDAAGRHAALDDNTIKEELAMVPDGQDDATQHQPLMVVKHTFSFLIRLIFNHKTEIGATEFMIWKVWRSLIASGQAPQRWH